jgi:hypothetical protein
MFFNKSNRADESAVFEESLGELRCEPISASLRTKKSPKQEREKVAVSKKYWFETHTGASATIVFQGYPIGLFKLRHGIYRVMGVANPARWKDGQDNNPRLALDPAFFIGSLADQIKEAIKEAAWERRELTYFKPHLHLKPFPVERPLDQVMAVIHNDGTFFFPRIVAIEE